MRTNYTSSDKQKKEDKFVRLEEITLEHMKPWEGTQQLVGNHDPFIL